MDCKRFEDKLNSWVDNSLPEDEIRDLKAHLSSCPCCARSLDDLKKTKLLLNRLDEIEPPAWFEQTLMQKIRAEQEKKTIWQKLFQPLYIKLPVQALATAVVVIIAIQVFRAVEPEVKTTIPPAPAPAPVTEAQREIDTPAAPAAVAGKKMTQSAPIQAAPAETKPAQQEKARQLKKEAPSAYPDIPSSAAEPPAQRAMAPSKESLAVKSIPAPAPAADYAGSIHEQYGAKQASGQRLDKAGAAAERDKKENEESVPVTKSFDSRKKAKAPRPGPAGAALLAQSTQSSLIIINPHTPETALEEIGALLNKLGAANIKAVPDSRLVTADVPAEKLPELSSQLARFGELRTVPATSKSTGTVHLSINIGPPSGKADENAR